MTDVKPTRKVNALGMAFERSEKRIRQQVETRKNWLGYSLRYDAPVPVDQSLVMEYVEKKKYERMFYQHGRCVLKIDNATWFESGD